MGARDAVTHEHEVDRDVYLLLRSRFAVCSGPACTAVVALLVLSRVMVHAMQHGSPTQPAHVLAYSDLLLSWVIIICLFLIWRCESEFLLEERPQQRACGLSL